MNRKDRLATILERDGHHCVWCGISFTKGLGTATTEHLVPKIKGGPSWLENELAACSRCNCQRGHMTVSRWLDECDKKGWSPNRAVVIRSLKSLKEAIHQRGGQRRARPYIDAQLRRIDK